MIFSAVCYRWRVECFYKWSSISHVQHNLLGMTSLWLWIYTYWLYILNIFCLWKSSSPYVLEMYRQSCSKWHTNTFPYSMGLLFVMKLDSSFLDTRWIEHLGRSFPPLCVFSCYHAMHSFPDEDMNRGKNIVLSYHSFDSWVSSQFGAPRFLG